MLYSRIKPIAVLCLLIIGGGAFSSSYAQPCENLMQYGLYNYDTNTFDEASSESMRRYFLDHDFESIEEMRSSARSFGFSIPIKAVQFGMNSSRGSARGRAKVVQSILQEDVELDKEFTKSIEQRSETISSDITDLVARCMEVPGLKVWIEEGKDRKQFKLFARRVGSNDNALVVNNFSIQPEDAVTFDVDDAEFFAPGAEITGSRRELIVTRTDSSAAVTVSLTATENPTWVSDDELLPLEDDSDLEALVGSLASRVMKLEEAIEQNKPKS